MLGYAHAGKLVPIVQKIAGVAGVLCALLAGGFLFLTIRCLSNMLK